MAQGEEGESETMAKRGAGSQTKLWLLMGADRWLVTVTLLVGVFCLLVVGGRFAPVSLPAAIDASDPVETLFQALVTAIITGVTLVVTIAQLVLSQELGAAGDQRERMEGSLAFRSDVADVVEAPVSPAEPSAFIRSLVDATRERAESLSDAVEGDQTVREQVQRYTGSLCENADLVSERLEGAEFGTFDVVLAALDFNYSMPIYEGKRLQAEYGDVLSEGAQEELDGIVETLKLFGPAREHIKTLYFQWELINLSRTILYAAVPALVVAVGGVLYLGSPGAVTGTTLGVANAVWVVSAATTISLAPFFILLSYVLRIVTVAKRTLAIGPLVLRETSRSGTVDWDGE